MFPQPSRFTEIGRHAQPHLFHAQRQPGQLRRPGSQADKGQSGGRSVQFEEYREGIYENNPGCKQGVEVIVKEIYQKEKKLRDFNHFNQLNCQL